MKKHLTVLVFILLSAYASIPCHAESTQAIVDTTVHKLSSEQLDSIEKKVIDISENTAPEYFIAKPFTIEWANLIFAILASVIGLGSLIFDSSNYRETKKTAQSVQRTSDEVQLGQFDDLIRHFYRNLVCSLAITRKMTMTPEHTHYPSEGHLLKLKVLPEDVLHLDKYNENNDMYKLMHELKLLLRNYDIEIDTALLHLKTGCITVNELKDDLGNLLFKPLFLNNKIATIVRNILKLNLSENSDPSIQQWTDRYVSKIILEEHLCKLRGNLEYLKKDKPVEPIAVDIDSIIQQTKIDEPYDSLRRGISFFRHKPAEKPDSEKR